jgi:hypothetical protein
MSDFDASQSQVTARPRIVAKAPAPPETLGKDETQEFLNRLFQNIARKPSPLGLREGAKVARFLRVLSLDAVPKIAEAPTSRRDSLERADDERERRLMVDKLGQLVFDTVCQWGEFPHGTKAQAMRFLRRHARTYFCPRFPGDTRLERVLAFIDAHELAKDAPRRFKPPFLIGPQLNAQGQGPYRLEDDVSERIFAAYHALGSRNRQRVELIRRALEEAEVARKRDKGSTKWSDADVRDRVRSYDRQLRSKRHYVRQKDEKVHQWVSGFHFAKSVVSGEIAGHQRDCATS